MPQVVADTHSLLWHLLDDPRLSQPAREALEEADQPGGCVLFSAITLVEILYLHEKGTISAEAIARLDRRLDEATPRLRVIAVDRQVVQLLPEFPRKENKDPWDRLIGASALRLRLPLVSRDRKIRHSALTVIW